MSDPRAKLESALLAAMANPSPMQWGRDDCALWCADIVKAGLGYDAAASFRGRYRTRIGAHRVLGRRGLAGALRAAARKHGWVRIKLGAEQTGDIGILMLGDVPVTVICRAPGWFLARNEQGWSAMPAEHVRIMWAVEPSLRAKRSNPEPRSKAGLLRRERSSQ